MTLKIVGGTEHSEGEGGRGFRAKRARVNDDQALEDMRGRALTDDERRAINRMYRDCLGEPPAWRWKQVAIWLASALVVSLALFLYLAIVIAERA